MSAIEVFADVWCPFTYVGLRRLIEERDRRSRADLVIRVRAWPLELVNGAPLDVTLVADEIQALRETVAPDLFGGFDPVRFPSTTLPALALAESAYRHGDRTGERMSVALRTALFEQGRDISSPTELDAIIGDVEPSLVRSEGREAVYDDWEEGRRRGVLGSPYFFVDGAGFFCPTLNITHFGGHLQVSVDPEAFTTFLETVFSR